MEQLVLADCIETDGSLRVSYGSHSIATLNIRRNHHGEIVGDLGFGVPAEFRGQGIATEAVRQIVAHGFARYAPAYIEDFITRDNAAAWRVLEKNGFRETVRDVSLDALGLGRADGVLRFVLRDTEHKRFIAGRA
jgi:RimJ/RimL family protein N-acetyltransferase